MRIVGGRLGGRTVRAPKGEATRPTSERAREAIASALDARGAIVDAQVLDLYAGSGALGLEMISRGAKRTLFVDRSAQATRSLTTSVRELGLGPEVEVLRADVDKPKAQAAIVERGPFSLVLADPPYRDAERAVRALEAMCEQGLVAQGAWILLETSSKNRPLLTGRLAAAANYRYGDTAVTFCRYGEEER